MPLRYSVNVNGAEIVHLLLQHGADADKKLRTRLHLASTSGSGTGTTRRLCVWRHPRGVAMLESCVLIQHGADVNAQDGSDKTPLHLVLFEENTETVLLMIQHGTDVNAQDGSHSTLLQLALPSGSVETAQLLVQHGADVSVKDTPRQQCQLQRRQITPIPSIDIRPILY